jgi:thioredoxin 1
MFLLAAIGGCQQATTPPAAESSRPAAVTVAKTAMESQLPKLLDLGADKCIPCKMMAPILEELRDEYAGKLDVQFVDVWQNPDIAKQYGLQQIPTQIFFDASGKEVFRHTGFFSKEEILKKWQLFGVTLDQPS